MSLTNQQIERAVLTIATGKQVYIQMAINLARSFKYWHRTNAIQFTLVTDQKHLIPKDLSDISVIEIEPGSYGNGFSTKLHLDVFAPARQTLFIDADCLCVGPLEPVFEKFKGHAVSVIGSIVSSGDFYGDVSSICQQFNVSGLPRFVGGIYYIEKGELSQKVFATARQLESSYDEIGLIRLRGVPNEEPLMAIAMAIHGQEPVLDDGSIKADSMFYPTRVEVDVFQGKASLWNIPGTLRHNADWPLCESHPLVVHFNSSFACHPPYTNEIVRLDKVLNKGWPLSIASLYAYLTCTLPNMLQETLKDNLRPIYRRIFGVRKVNKSVRM